MIQKHTSSRRKSQHRFLFAALVLPGALLVPLYLAFAQQNPAAVLDAESTSRAIINHLNSVIQFYRTLAQPIQKSGEPNDIVYRDQAATQSGQIASFAFQSAKAEAALIQRAHPGASAVSGSNEQQRMETMEASVEARIADLQQRIEALDHQIPAAKPSAVAALVSQKKQLQSALELNLAMKDALARIVGMSAAAGATGLLADIGRLQQSVPELQTSTKAAIPQLTTIDSAISAGVTTQASVLFDLLESSHTLQALVHENDNLHQQALNLRTPMGNIVRSLIQQGQQLSVEAEAAPPPPPTPAPKTRKSRSASAKSSAAKPAAAAVKPAAPAAPQAAPASPPPPSLQSITANFKAVSAATVPLSQEIIVLEESRANLTAWQTSVSREYSRVLHNLLLRVLVIAIALCVIIGGGEIWTRAATRYIHDIRRRRQILIVRRVVVGFLSALVILFGFVTQFHSLATFAGFITAGIAVGLQTMLLSVAAYFFIIGRYGIKVGDRISIASVTGEVIDVGLVRFYVMELAGTGPELNPTGRIAVFSNAVLFQAGTPLYKQMPGTAYAWHELTVKLADAADYKVVCEAVQKAVSSVYEEYRRTIEQQHQNVQNWMQTSIDTPQIDTRLQFTGGVFQLWARFPVEIRRSAAIDEKITRALLELMAANPAVKGAVAAPPSIQASVRG